MSAGHFIDFKRFDHTHKTDGYVYAINRDAKDCEYDFNSANMRGDGYNQHVTIKNYTEEPVVLGGSLKGEPRVISSLIKSHIRPMDGLINCVMIVILVQEHMPSADSKKRTIQSTKTTIKIPAKLFNQGSVFIKELDCYLSSASQYEATRALMGKDLLHGENQSVNIPATMVRPDPTIIYSEHKELARNCTQHQDRMVIRVGYDIRNGYIPDYIKNFRLALYDSYFSPYFVNKLIYDASLDPDAFVIENLYIGSSESYTGSFTQLNQDQAIYLVNDQRETMFGSFYAMVLFANERELMEYIYQRKSQQRYDEESSVLARRSGDPKLREELIRVETRLNETSEALSERDTEVTKLNADVASLKRRLKDREDALSKLENGHDAKYSQEAVMGNINNTRERIKLEQEQLGYDRIENDYKAKAAPMQHRAAMLKAIGEMMKSGWALVAAVMAGVLSIVTLCKKYNVRLSVGEKSPA